MGQSRKMINEDNFREWLASTGNLFPSNDVELSRFEKLYSDFEYTLNENCVDPFAIINVDFKPSKIKLAIDKKDINNDIKMAARNLENVPEHILRKLKRNQNGPNSEKKGGS